MKAFRVSFKSTKQPRSRSSLFSFNRSQQTIGSTRQQLCKAWQPAHLSSGHVARHESVGEVYAARVKNCGVPAALAVIDFVHTKPKEMQQMVVFVASIFFFTQRVLNYEIDGLHAIS